MQELGTDLMLVCSNVAADALGEPALLADDLRLLAERAAVRGLRIGYEALAWGRQVNTWEQAWDLVRRADQANLGLILDSFHTLSLDGDPRGIADLPGEKIFFVQVADAPLLAMDVLEWRPATSAASRVRAASTWQASSRRSSRPAIAVRCRWRSSTTASAPRRPAPTPSTACARCSTSRRRPASACNARRRTWRWTSCSRRRRRASATASSSSSSPSTRRSARALASGCSDWASPGPASTVRRMSACCARATSTWY
ncbi:sugar phosphate isomerase/epimerase [Pseudomonas aeruginosa]|uniref:sugar phosphate isomerase/epimerase family protein n=1 Tax=Pseudomonas aeruginosa TaxID=287 RepID=UPI003D2D3C16